MSKIKQLEIPIDFGSLVKLTKLTDDKFNKKHPNNINEGFQVVGRLSYPIKTGFPCIIGGFHTSTVTKIISKTKFKTLNSTYEIVYY